MRICFELLEMLKAHKKAIRRAAVNTFGYIAKAIGPQDVLHTLLNNLKVQERLRGLYEYLVENGFIRQIDDYNEGYLSIFSRTALEKIRAGDPEWETMVPERVAVIIKERGLLGLKLLAT